MAFRYLVRPIYAFSFTASPLTRPFRSYSQIVTKAYENLLVELPKPGVSLSMHCQCLCFFHSVEWLKLSADTLVARQSPLIVQEPSMPCPPPYLSN